MKLLNHIGLSSGKDSTALWGWAINDSGYPVESIRGSFADTENEYPEVYQQIDALDKYGQERGVAPVRTLHSEGFLALAVRKKRFPSARARCFTSPGVGEVGCKLCCMGNKQDVRITAKTKPETINQYREWERIVGSPDLTQARLLPGKSRCHVPTFFRATTVPEGLRSVKGLVRRKDSKRGKKGETYSACTIDDVVKWSMTLRGGKQLGMDFMYDDSPIFEIDDAHAPCKSGYCE